MKKTKTTWYAFMLVPEARRARGNIVEVRRFASEEERAAFLRREAKNGNRPVQLGTEESKT